MRKGLGWEIVSPKPPTQMRMQELLTDVASAMTETTWQHKNTAYDLWV